jgi:hypothetical protein
MVPPSLNQLEAIAVGQHLKRLLGLDEPGLKRQAHCLDVGLPEAGA